MKSESLITQVVDITPTPRILRTLGDIPFAAWQCLAELTDNSLETDDKWYKVAQESDRERGDEDVEVMVPEWLSGLTTV